MRRAIFWKSLKLVDKVIQEGEAHNREFFSFKDIEDPPKITICYEDKKTLIEVCTCTNCSVLGGVYPAVLCSYKLAVLKALPLKNE